MLSDEEIKQEAIWAIRRNGMKSALLQRAKFRRRRIFFTTVSAVAAMLAIGLILKVNTNIDSDLLNTMADTYYSEVPLSKGGEPHVMEYMQMYDQQKYREMRLFLYDSVLPALNEVMDSTSVNENEPVTEVIEYEKQQAQYYLELVRWVEALSYIKTKEFKTASEKLKTIYDEGGSFSAEACSILEKM